MKSVNFSKVLFLVLAVSVSIQQNVSAIDIEQKYVGDIANQLNHESFAVRTSAIRALSAIKSNDPGITQRLVNLIDHSGYKPHSIKNTLNRFRTQQHIDSKTSAIYWDLAAAIGNIGTKDKAVILKFSTLLTTDDLGVQLRTAEAIGKINLRTAVSNGEYQDTVEQILANAQTSNKTVVSYLKCLIYQNVATEICIEQYLLKDKKTEFFGLHALGNISDSTSDAINNTLAGYLYSSNPLLRARAADEIGNNGVTNSEIIKKLSLNLKDSDEQVKYYTVSAYGQCVSIPNQIETDSFIDLLNDPSEVVRGYAAEVLGGWDATIETGNLSTASGQLKVSSIVLYPELTEVAVIFNIHSSNANKIDEIIGLLAHSSQTVRYSAAVAIGKLKITDSRDLNAIAAHFNNQNPEVVSAAIYAFQSLAEAN